MYHDLAHHHYPWRTWAGQTWAAGELPLWAPVGHGFPLLAEAQVGAAYPLNILLWGLFSAPVAFNWSIGLHHLMALWGSFALARHLGRTSTAALCSAVAYGFSGFFVSHLVYLGFFQVMAWFPWMMTSAIQAARYGKGWWPALALTTGMAWLCGHPQAAYLATVAAVFVLGWQGVRVRRTRGWTPLLGGALAMVLAAGISMPQWLATSELVAEGVRSEGLDESEASLGSLPPEELANALFPRTFGYERPIDIPVVYGHRGGGYVGRGVSYWETCFYMGVPTVLLLFVAGWSKATRMWWVLMGAGVIVMLGVNTPLYGLLLSLPGMAYFRFPVRGAMWVSLAAAMLAGRGIDRLGNQGGGHPVWGERRLWMLLAGVVVVTGMMCAGHVALTQHGESAQSWLAERLERPEATTQGGPARDAAAASARAAQVITAVTASTAPFGPQVGWFFAMGLLTIVPWLLVRRGTLVPGAPSQLLVGLLITDLFLFAFDFNPRIPMDGFDQRPASTVPMLGKSRGYRTTTVEKRVDVRTIRDVIPASQGLLWGLDDVGLPSPLRMRRNEQYLEAVGLGFAPTEAQQRWAQLWDNKHLLDLSGVRFLYTTSEARSDALTLMWSGDGTWLYENASALPRAFLVGCTDVVAEDEAFTAVVRNRTPAYRAIVEDGPTLPGCTMEPIGRVDATRKPGGGWALNASVDSPGWLVLTESFYPDFQWKVDGLTVPYYRTNYLFQGIPIQPGEHTIHVVYRPMWLFGALALSWLMLFAVLGWLSISRFPGAYRIILEFPVVRPQDIDSADKKS